MPEPRGDSARAFSPGIAGRQEECHRGAEGSAPRWHSSCWCPRPESNRHDREVEGFSCHFGFRRQRASCRCSWSGARLHPGPATVGARRLLSTPSVEPVGTVSPAWLGVGSATRATPDSRPDRQSARAFTEFDGFHLRRFPRRAQIASSPLCLPISPLGHAGDRIAAAGSAEPSRIPSRSTFGSDHRRSHALRFCFSVALT